MNPGLTVRICPRDLPVPLNFDGAVGQLKVKSEQSSRNLRLCRQYVHAGLREIKQDAIQFSSVRQCDSYWSLNRHSESFPPLAAEHSCCSAKARLRRFFRNRFVKYEMRTAGENLSDLCGIGN